MISTRLRGILGVLVIATPLALAIAPAVRAVDVEWLELPAFVKGETPWLRGDGDGLALSWVVRDDDRFLLRASRYADEQWRAPVTIHQGSDWFNNAADFARVMPLGDGAQLAVWLELTSFRDLYYRPRAALSGDGGVEWRPVGYPAGKVQHGQQGFFSALRRGSHSLLFWIAGFRDEAVLWRARLAETGEWSVPEALDRRVCSCCRTSAAPSGALVYRDRDPEEIRDIAVITDAATSTASRRLHADGWRIAGCPVNGPAIAESAQGRAVGWFTAANERAETRLAVDAAPIVSIAVGRSRGLIDLAWLDGGRLALSTVTRDRGIEINLVDTADGAPSVERVVTIPVNTGLVTPSLAVLDHWLYVALYDVDDDLIRIARIDTRADQR